MVLTDCDIKGYKKSDMEFYLSAMVYNLRKAGLKLEALKS